MFDIFVDPYFDFTDVNFQTNFASELILVFVYEMGKVRGVVNTQANIYYETFFRKS